MEIKGKTNSRITVWTSDLTSEHVSKGTVIDASEGFPCSHIGWLWISRFITNRYGKSECPSKHEWIKTAVHTACTVECYCVFKRREILSFGTT